MSKMLLPICFARNIRWWGYFLYGLLMVFLSASLMCPGPSFAQQQRKDSLQQQQRKARDQRQAISKLGEREKALQAELDRYQKQLGQAEAALKKAEQHLADIDKEEKQLEKKYLSLLKDKEHTADEMRRLLGSMWEMHVKSNEVGRESAIPDWDQADRELVWSSEFYRQASEKMAILQRQEEELKKVLSSLSKVNQEANARLEAANKSKDVVLNTKLDHMRELGRLRKEKTDREAELASVLKVIDSLNYTLERPAVQSRQSSKRPVEAKPERAEKRPEGKGGKGDKTGSAARPQPQIPPTAGGSFAAYKGRLPWPVNGSVSRKYNPSASPPRRGVGLSAGASSPVKAVFNGRVVHNEVLRGFGRVVIILHSGNYYSLYAFLNDSNVRVGQQVSAGQAIGSAGYYPDLKGPGLYFELRFQQKPINPEQWLASRK